MTLKYHCSRIKLCINSLHDSPQYVFLLRKINHKSMKAEALDIVNDKCTKINYRNLEYRYFIEEWKFKSVCSLQKNVYFSLKFDDVRFFYLTPSS